LSARENPMVRAFMMGTVVLGRVLVSREEGVVAGVQICTDQRCLICAAVDDDLVVFTSCHRDEMPEGVRGLEFL
jgi:hypothetical protein